MIFPLKPMGGLALGIPESRVEISLPFTSKLRLTPCQLAVLGSVYMYNIGQPPVYVMPPPPLKPEAINLAVVLSIDRLSLVLMRSRHEAELADCTMRLQARTHSQRTHSHLALYPFGILPGARPSPWFPMTPSALTIAGTVVQHQLPCRLLLNLRAQNRFVRSCRCRVSAGRCDRRL